MASKKLDIKCDSGSAENSWMRRDWSVDEFNTMEIWCGMSMKFVLMWLCVVSLCRLCVAVWSVYDCVWSLCVWSVSCDPVHWAGARRSWAVQLSSGHSEGDTTTCCDCVCGGLCMTVCGLCLCVCGLSALIQFTEPVLVDREQSSSRQDTVKEIQRRAATRGAWPQIVVFNEGTCTNRSCLISFKPGSLPAAVFITRLKVLCGNLS